MIGKGRQDVLTAPGWPQMLMMGWLDESGLFSVRDTSRTAYRQEIILDMLRSEPVLCGSVTIWQVVLILTSHLE